MKLGDWELSSVMAGRFGLDGGAMFGVVPRVMWEKQLPPDDFHRIPMVMRLLIAKGQGRTVLVDVGAGGGYNEKMLQIYGLEDHDFLRDSIDAAGIPPAEITDVLLTHLHFDHGAGVVEPDGDGWRLLFPQARHHVQRSQWEHAFNPNPRDRASYFQERLRLMEDEGVLELHNGEWKLAPEFQLLVFDGHTPGQQLPLIGNENGALFYTGDLIPTRHHLPAPYIMAYDLDPVLAMEEKAGIVESAVENDWILFFEHDADTEACRVVRDGRKILPGDPIALG